MSGLCIDLMALWQTPDRKIRRMISVFRKKERVLYIKPPIYGKWKKRSFKKELGKEKI